MYTVKNGNAEPSATVATLGDLRRHFLKRHHVSPESPVLARYAAKKRKSGALAPDSMERSRDDSLPVAIGANVPSSNFPLAGGELRRVTRTTHTRAPRVGQPPKAASV